MAPRRKPNTLRLSPSGYRSTKSRRALFPERWNPPYCSAELSPADEGNSVSLTQRMTAEEELAALHWPYY